MTRIRKTLASFFSGLSGQIKPFLDRDIIIAICVGFLVFGLAMGFIYTAPIPSLFSTSNSGATCPSSGCTHCTAPVNCQSESCNHNNHVCIRNPENDTFNSPNHTKTEKVTSRSTGKEYDKTTTWDSNGVISSQTEAHHDHDSYKEGTPHTHSYGERGDHTKAGHCCMYYERKDP